MPTSSNTFDDVLIDHIVFKLKPTSVLDVGAGAGKNGKLIRSKGYTGQLDAVEPTASYVEQFSLEQTYNKIYPVDLRTFLDTEHKFKYDVAVFGDVLEHFYRSQVIDYLDYVLYKVNWAIVIWPNFVPQEDDGNNPYEIHKSNFTLTDLSEKFDVQYFIKNFGYFNGDMSKPGAVFNYAVLKGHMARYQDSVYNFRTWK